MASLITSTVVTILMIGVLLLVARRREPGTPLTWAEAFAAATYLFLLMMMVYAIVPNQWMTYADSELKWRKDVFFDPWGTGSILPIKGWGRVTFPKEALRDIIVSGIYGAGLVGHVLGWLAWQRRGKAKPSTAVDTSAFGRPLVKST